MNPMTLKQFAKQAWQESRPFHLCQGPALDTDLDDAVKAALGETPVAGMVRGTTQLTPKIDEDGYFGADFLLILNNDESFPVEMFVHSDAIKLFFREP